MNAIEKKTYRILIVEDMPADAELNRRETLKALPESEFRIVETEVDFLDALSTFNPDIILSDYTMPEFDGMTALALAKKHTPDVPVIMVTGSINEDTAVDCLKAGATDYVIKQSIKRLGPAINHALVESRQKMEYRLSQMALVESEKRYRSLFELSPVGIVLVDEEGKILNVNETYCKITGYTAIELIGQPIKFVAFEIEESKIKENLKDLLAGRVIKQEVRNRHKNGQPVLLELSESAVVLENGKKGIMSIAVDITERKQMDERIQQKNRMLQFLSDYALKITALSNSQPIEQLITEEFRQFTGSHFAIFSLYSSREKALHVKYISTLPQIRENIIINLGEDILYSILPLSDENLSLMIRTPYHVIHTLSELSFGALPAELDYAFAGLSGINRFYAIPLYIDDTFFGTTVIGLQQDQADPDPEMLRSFSYLTSLMLERMEAENELKDREVRLRKILDSAQDAMIIIDNGGNVYIWNHTAELMFGYTEQETLGKNVHQLIAPKRYHAIHQEKFKEFLVNGTGEAIGKIIEIEACRKDGTEFPVELALSPIEIDNALFSIGVIRDITERKKAMESIERSEKRYHSLFDANMYGVAVLLINPDDTVTLFAEINETAAAMLGYTREEMLQIPLEMLEPENNAQVVEERRFDLKNKGFTHFETNFKHKSGHLIPVEISVSMIMYEDRPALLHIVRDNSERRFRENLQILQYKIANAGITSPNLRAYYDTVLEALSSMIDTTNFFIAFYDNQTGMLSSPYVKEEEEEINYWPADLSLTGMVVKQNKTVFLNKNQITELAEKGKIKIYGMRCEIWLGVPLTTGADAFGAVVVQSYVNPLAYDERSKFILEMAAHEFSLYFEKKEAERNALKLSRAVEQNPVSIVITNNEGKIEYVNPKFTEVTGYTFEEAVGNNPRILKSGHHDHAFYKNLWDTLKQGNNWNGELMNLRKNGEFYWENALISPIKDDTGTVTHFVAVKEDITEKKYIKEELKKAKEKAEESDRLKTSFLQNISHEIRTPLNGILGFSELIIQDWVGPEERLEYNEAIQTSGKRLVEIVNNVLDISFIETGQVIINHEPVNLNALMRELYNFYHRQTSIKNIALESFQALPDEQCTVSTDKQRLNQIMSNLLNNALKYTKQGSIRFGYTVTNGELVFEVKDTGIGIGDEHKDKIFTRFYQADNSTHRSYEGAGLGLSISYGLVTAMGGRMWFDSTSGKGSTFSFCIKVPEMTDLMLQMNSGKNPSDSKKSRMVLISDDDDTSYMLLNSILRKHKVSTIRAVTGDEAVEIVRKHAEISLVFMDVKMPEMDGFEATQLIKSFRPDMPVIIQTAYAYQTDIEQAFNSGCDEYLSKPIMSDKLMMILEKYLDKTV